MRRHEAVGVGEQLGELVPVGVVVEQHPDHVGAPLGAEVRRTEVLERHHLVGLGAERDPEQLVLAAEDVRDRGLADPPPGADPGVLLDRPRQPAEDPPDPEHHALGDQRALGRRHGTTLPRLTDTAPSRGPVAQSGHGRRHGRVRRPPAAGASCRGANGVARRTTARSRSAAARRTPSRAPSTRCSGCSRSAPVSGCSTWAPARAGPPRSWPTSSGAPAASSVWSWSPTWSSSAAPTSARTGQPWARIEQAEPGVLGSPAEAPYDRILVSAEPRELPTELVDQLAATACWSSPWRAPCCGSPTPARS